MEQTTLLNRSSKIGLIADSHGNLRSIQKGIHRLEQSQAEVLVHLGDIFDSQEIIHIHEIFNLITRHNILAVKGNNDYHIENLLVNGHSFDISAAKRNNILSYLIHLPMLLIDDKFCFAHSLPFNSIRSFYEPVDTGGSDRARRVFNETPYKILFCGHSHSSIMFRWSSGKVTRERIHSAGKISFNPSERYIIIVGSSENGECGIFDKEAMTYQRLAVDA